MHGFINNILLLFTVRKKKDVLIWFGNVDGMNDEKMPKKIVEK